MRLRHQDLARLGAHVDVPRYDRAALTPAVVHISVGSFHRSHQAVYLDRLARRGHTAWGLTGVGLHRSAVCEALEAQDGLYTVLTRGPEGETAQVVGVMGACLFAGAPGTAVLDTLADPRTRLVTLTVTGAGYDLVDPEVAADRADGCVAPRSALGHLVAALARRHAAGVPPFTVLSCDNLPGNGPLARAGVLALAEARDPALATWIAEHGAFPSSMVDRITPQTADEDRERLAREHGIEDRSPVVTEPFSEWVVEDDFCHGRPPLDEVGVRFVDDVRPYALRKTRLLNAAHCALGALGGLAGHERTDEAMADPLLGGYAEALLREVGPLLPELPGTSLAGYRETVLGRLANPGICDRLERLRRNGSHKVPAHVLSSLTEARASGRSSGLLLLAVAGWCRTAAGVDEAGRPLAVDDEKLARLRPLATPRPGVDLRPFLREAGVFGALADDARFADDLRDAIVELAAVGVRAALAGRLPVRERLVAA